MGHWTFSELFIYLYMKTVIVLSIPILSNKSGHKFLVLIIDPVKRRAGLKLTVEVMKSRRRGSFSLLSLLCFSFHLLTDNYWSVDHDFQLPAFKVPLAWQPGTPTQPVLLEWLSGGWGVEDGFTGTSSSFCPTVWITSLSVSRQNWFWPKDSKLSKFVPFVFVCQLSKKWWCFFLKHCAILVSGQELLWKCFRCISMIWNYDQNRIFKHLQ